MPLSLERPAPVRASVTRRFAASPDRVFAAHVDAALVVRWLTGPDGWVMTRCEMDPRPGGAIHYAWRQGEGEAGFHLTGEVEEIAPPGLMRHVERMHLPDPTPVTRVETRFAADGSGTAMTMTMAVDDPATMDAMVASGMAEGMEASYARLDRLLAEG